MKLGYIWFRCYDVRVYILSWILIKVNGVCRECREMEYVEKCREKVKNFRFKDLWIGEDGLSFGKVGSLEDFKGVSVFSRFVLCLLFVWVSFFKFF